ncbi:MAG: type II toxin-antitoxin system VapC family toxin [Candidatus Binataceae bacterium]
MPVAPLDSIASGADILLDANILIYALTESSEQCRRLLGRCASEELCGVTTVEIVNETCHRLMLAEALHAGLISAAQAKLLRAKRTAIPSFSEYWTKTKQLFGLGFLVIGLEEQRVRRAHEMRKRYALLTNDSLIIAAADEYGIRGLASNDADFDDIPWLTVYKPGDIL